MKNKAYLSIEKDIMKCKKIKQPMFCNIIKKHLKGPLIFSLKHKLSIHSNTRESCFFNKKYKKFGGSSYRFFQAASENRFRWESIRNFFLRFKKIIW